MSERILITGAGIVSALGIGMEDTYRALLRGDSCIGKIRYLQTEHTEFPVGEVPMSNEEMACLLGASYPVSALRTVMMGILAAREAVGMSGLDTKMLENSAFISGTTVGGMDNTEAHFSSLLDAGATEADFDVMKYNDCGASTDLIAKTLGRFRMVTTTSTACSSAANAIILGANLIRAGIVERAVVGGAEALTRFHLNGFNTLMILDTERCRPFDSDRHGINLGEGAAYIVLESESSARTRNAKIMAELCGYANACDAFHQTATSENGEGAFLAMSRALAMAGVAPESVDYINAHGTGTPNNDVCELAAMRRIWGDKLPRFSSTKAFTGHTTSASGSIEAVICLLAIMRGLIPRNIGWANPIEEGAVPVLDNVVDTDISYVVDNSFGFGGNDSSLVFSKYKDGDGE